MSRPKSDGAILAAIAYGPDDATQILIPRQRLQMRSVDFKRGKWRLSDGANTRWYAIKDETFVREVEQGLRRFGSGDLLVCAIVMNQTVENGQLKLEYEITDVLSYIVQPEQGRFKDVQIRGRSDSGTFRPDSGTLRFRDVQQLL